MINILEIDPVLTAFPYALLYYALLLASSGLALIAVIRSNHVNKTSLQTALIIIFFSQLVLLTLNLLAYQGFQLVKALFPLTHRVLNLVCLLWLIWSLFISREKTHPSWPPLALTVVLLIAGIIFSLWWLPYAALQDFNLTWIDYALVGITLALIVVSAIIYSVRYRTLRVEAWLIFSIAAAGFVLYLLLPSAGNLPATVMLSQIIYYPLLISLASQKFQDTQSETDLTQTTQDHNEQLRANVADAFLEISLQPSQNQLEKALTHSLSLYLMADLLGLIQFEQGSNQALLKNTYDLIREDHLEKVDLSTDEMPGIFEKLTHSEALTSNRESEFSFEKQYLMKACGYNQIGNLLLFPLQAIPDQPRWAFLGLSPYTNREWGLEDLKRLDRLQDNLSRVLEKAGLLEQDARQMSNLQAKLLQKESEFEQVTQVYSESQIELQSLTDDLHQAQVVWTEEVNQLIEHQKELENEIDLLQQTIADNAESLAEVNSLRNQKEQLEEILARKSEQTDQLKTTIEQAGQLLKQLTNQDEVLDQAEESKG